MSPVAMPSKPEAAPYNEKVPLELLYVQFVPDSSGGAWSRTNFRLFLWKGYAGVFGECKLGADMVRGVAFASNQSLCTVHCKLV